MILKQDQLRLPALSATILLLFAGLLAVPWMCSDSSGSAGIERTTEGPFQPGAGAASAAAPGAAELAKLQIEIAPRHTAVLQAARDRAIAGEVLVTRDGEIVPARVRLDDGPFVRARIRLKGDLLDHVSGDKWSFRIELLDGHHFGMSTYSIQNPTTRGILFEWLIMAVARRDGLLAPRATYVHVEVNSRPNGVYYLEEHFTKELLESQGRRDGPIVKFREDTLWNTLRQYDHEPDSYSVAPMLSLATGVHIAEVGAFDEKRLGRTEQLNARLQRALARIRQAQRVALAAAPRMPLATLQALDELRGETLDELFVADKLGHMTGLSMAFRAWHGLAWHQLRYYHDPVLDRLEPILFDTGANPFGHEAFEGMLSMMEVSRADDCYEAGYHALAKITHPSYLAEIFAEFGAELDRYCAAMQADGTIPANFSIDLIRRTLADNCAEIRNLISPEDAANFSARQVVAIDADGQPFDLLEVEAWSTTQIATAVHEFVFSNGRTIAAATALDESDGRYRRPAGRAALPRSGRRIVFRFPVDKRLSALRDVKAIKRAVREQSVPDQNAKLRVDVRYAPIAAEASTVERLRIRRVGDAALLTMGRPTPPSLLEALDRHKCLAYEFDTNRIVLRAGTWNVDGDLLIPAGFHLEATGGVELRFGPGAIFLSESPLILIGTGQAKIKLSPIDAVAGWGGLVVIETDRRSRLEHVEIRSTNATERGGWQLTGGVTFYRAPVDITHSTLADARGEDALNVFGCDVQLHHVQFSGGASDLFDGDFVTAQIHDCKFSDSVEDAIDVSGSQLTVQRCGFHAIGDKALSIGENSRATIDNCEIEHAGIALAAKDKSRVDVTGLHAASVDHFLIAVYTKKPAYGPSKVQARRASTGSGDQNRYLVQTGCTLEVDGVPIPTSEVDVDELYRRTGLDK